MNNGNYIPAMRFHWLTRVLMPEKESKNALLHNANIQDNYTVLDFGIGTATLSNMAYKFNPKANYRRLDIHCGMLKITKHHKTSRI